MYVGLIPLLGEPITAAMTAINAPTMLTSLSDNAEHLYFTVAMIGFVFGVNLVFGFWKRWATWPVFPMSSIARWHGWDYKESR